MFKSLRVKSLVTVGLSLVTILILACPALVMADTRTKPVSEVVGDVRPGALGLTEFEIDGNALDAATIGEDWDLLYGGGGTYQIWTGIMSDTLSIYKGGTDLDDFPALSWEDAAALDKGDLLHAYVAMYPDNHIFFGADRFATTGNTYMGFWLLQNPVYLDSTDGSFDGTRTLGDILILADFTQGGGTVVIGVYEWGGEGNLIPRVVDPNTSFAIVNSIATASPWPYVPKSGPANIFPAGAFFEGGADLGALGIEGCYTHFIAETRASSSLNSVLKDFVLGALPTRPYASINPSPASMCYGDPGVSLCAEVVPGTGAPPFTYSWSGPGTYDPTDSCIVVGSGFAAGDYTYTLVVEGCNGCASDTVSTTLTVYEAPTGSIDGPSTVCPGSTNDHCGPLDMASYSWSISGNGSIVGATDSSCVQVLAGTTCNDSYTLNLSFTNEPGCAGTAEKTVSIEDATAPVITCPADLTVECSASVDPTDTGSATATDNCGGTPTITYGDVITPGACPDSYTIARTWRAEDACENAATCVQTITVRDRTAPAFNEALPGDVTVECDAVPLAATLTATDACDDAVPVQFGEVRTDGSCPDAYTLRRTWTAADDCGNSVQHVQVVTVVDTTDPVFDGPLPVDVTVECNQVPMPATLTASDNCDSDVTVSFDEQRADGSCPDAYTLTRTWTAADDCGNSVQHVQIVTVVDTTDPVFDQALPGDVTVECNRVPLAPTLTATDNCDADVPVSYDEQRTGGACPDAYTLTRTWTATDDCGNTAQHVQIVTVVDTTDPVFNGPLPGDVTVECDNVPGPATLTATDNCDADVYVDYDEQRTDGSCPDSYTLTRTWTAADDCGNEAQHVQIVTVVDTTDPVFDGPLPRDVTVECDDVPGAPTLTASDNCDADVYVDYDEQRADGACPDSYTLTRTWTAADDCGNDVEHVQIVTVVDTTDPVFDGPLPGDVTAECDNVPPAATLTATDNCDADVYVDFDERRADGACPDSYTLTRVWTATDDCGNDVEHTQIVTVVDTTDPVFDGPLPDDVTVECDDVPGAPTLTATDNCDADVYVDYDERRSDGACPDSYTLTRTWIASDDCGNEARHVQEVTVVDRTAPTISCPSQIDVQCIEDVPPPSIGQVTASDNCDDDVNVDWVGDEPDGGTCPLTITRTYRAVDDCGNSDICTQLIVVEDTIDPTISCPNEIRVQCESEVPAPSPDVVFASDNCDRDVSVMWDGDVSDGQTCPETITRTYRATDDCGNSNTCTQAIIIWDTIPPQITCPPDDRFECDEPVDFGTPTAYDNCDMDLTITFDDETLPGGSPFEYTIVRTWTATDDCSNQASCDQRVTVYDDTPPVITCPPDDRFECDDQVEFGWPTVDDNCDSDPDVTWDDEMFAGSCPGEYQIVRTWTATDAVGNQASCDQTITVYDDSAPVLVCPPDITFECDLMGDPGDATATDNCDPNPPVTSSDRIEPGPCAEAYTIVRTWRVMDACGNESTCDQLIHVQDTTPPEITCPPDSSFEVGENIDFGQPIVIDRCDSEVDVTWDDQRFDADCPQAYTIVRTWTATDNCGNSASCQQRITVGDQTPPVITCPGDRTFQCDQEVVFGQATAVDVGDPNPVITYVDNEIPGNCSQARVIERTWIATDACGNADSCVQVVRVVDNTPPVIICPANRTFSCNEQPVFGEATATDNCNPAPAIGYVDNTIPGGNPQEYVIERTWTATDGCGNSASCVQRVSIEDNSAPTLVGSPGYTVICDQPVVFTDPTATDVCDPAPVISVVSNTVLDGPGECEVSYTRCWVARDAAGNVSNQVCQTIVRYEDTEGPVLTCAADKIILPGEPVVFDEPAVTDNCPIPGADFPELTFSESVSIEQQETTYTRCWIARDLCNNESNECCQNITVSAPPEPPPYCSFVCWNWTAACLKDPYNHEISTPPACLRDEHFDDVFPNGVTIGSHARPGLYTATWTSARAVETFKCAYGLPEPLHQNWIDPRTTDLGALQAELLTLKLNREFSCQGYFEQFGYPLGEGCFGELIVPIECLRFAGLTVDQFIAIADLAVAGDKSVLLPYGYSYYRLHSAAAYLNWLYGECNGYGSLNGSGPVVLGGTDGDAGWEDEVAATAVPTEFSMTGSPNPMRGSVTITLALPAAGDVSLDIYDVQGRVVTTLMRGQKSAGYYSVTWDGADGFGARVSSGVYFCRVQVDGQLTAMEKLMKL